MDGTPLAACVVVVSQPQCVDACRPESHSIARSIVHRLICRASCHSRLTLVQVSPMLRRSVHAVWSSTSSSTSQPCHFRRLLSTSATTPPAAWTRLVRYVNAEGRVAYGEPVHAHTVVGEHEHVHGEEPLRVHPVSFSHPLGMLAISSSDDDGTLVHRDRVDTVQRVEERGSQ